MIQKRRSPQPHPMQRCPRVIELLRAHALSPSTCLVARKRAWRSLHVARAATRPQPAGRALLPEHPPYYDKEHLTDRPERFFASEMLREAIFEHYQDEIPYSCECKIESFKEGDALIKIAATIYVSQESQKGIVIGHKGNNLKKVGTRARKRLEEFFQKQVYIETRVKVKPNWRQDEDALDAFGYNL